MSVAFFQLLLRVVRCASCSNGDHSLCYAPGSGCFVVLVTDADAPWATPDLVICSYISLGATINEAHTYMRMLLLVMITPANAWRRRGGMTVSLCEDILLHEEPFGGRGAPGKPNPYTESATAGGTNPCSCVIC